MDRICGAALRWRALKLMVDGGWSDLKPLGSVDGNGR